jgi:hypothetical protein
MSWINERTIQYQYKFTDGEIRLFELLAGSVPPEKMEDVDGSVGTYIGFLPDKINQQHGVEYDQNGRKAMRIRNKDGSITHISKTKLHYMKTGRIENQYTKAFQEKLQKEQQEQLLRSEQGRGRGSVQPASARRHDLEAKLGALPDGEYVSDGASVMPAPTEIKP